MIRNYLLIAWRNITKRKFYSLLNIFGLSIGIVVTLMIGAFVWSEYGINRGLKNARSQFFLETTWKDPNLGNGLTTMGPLSKRLKEDYPALVANYYRWDGITSVVSKGDKHLRENIQVGDSTLLSMFGFKLLHGDARTALEQPFSTVITQEIAKKYFGRTDVVGQTIAIQNFAGSSREFAITGVLDRIPENSVTDINPENDNNLFISFNALSYFGRGDVEDWRNTIYPSFIELKEGIKPSDLEQPIRQLIAQNAPAFVKENATVKAVPLTRYYLDRDNGTARRMLYTLSVVGFFILLMAVVNFINISISSSSSRLKEMGLRKVLGGLRKQIVVQLLVESVLLVAFATALAFLLYPFAQSFFAGIVGKQIPSLVEFPLYFLLLPFLLILSVGLLAGLYPAFVLSGIGSVDSLKGKLKTVGEKIWLRKSLAGFQFAVAAIVLIAAFVVGSQVAHFFSKGLGYDKSYMVSSQVPRDWTPEGVRKMETIRNEFAKLPAVADVTLSFEIPNGMNSGSLPVYRQGTDSTQAVNALYLITDEHYLDTYQVPLKAGKFLSTAGSFDPSGVVLNEKAVKALGWDNTEEAIGKQLRIPGSAGLLTVAGVSSDFYFTSMRTSIEPLLFMHPRVLNSYRYLSFRIKPGSPGTAIAAITKKWAELLPGSSFEYRFMDETLARVYRNEIKLKRAAYAATALALVIALLGVIGLVSLSVRKRTKEIGIRKVLGASLPGIISIFLKEFFWVLLVAAFIACPVAWFLMRGWLAEYADRISLTAVPFLVSLAGLALVTILLIVLQTLKAGAASPVKSLRTE